MCAGEQRSRPWGGNIASQSNLAFAKCRLNKVLRGASWHKEPSLKARLELFTTNINVLEMRWQHVPNLGCHNMEIAWTTTGGRSMWYKPEPGICVTLLYILRTPGF